MTVERKILAAFKKKATAELAYLERAMKRNDRKAAEKLWIDLEAIEEAWAHEWKKPAFQIGGGIHHRRRHLADTSTTKWLAKKRLDIIRKVTDEADQMFQKKGWV